MRTELIKVTTKKNGFRRGGREWHGETVVLLKDFSKKQIEQIRNESKLVLTEPSEKEIKEWEKIHGKLKSSASKTSLDISKKEDQDILAKVLQDIGGDKRPTVKEVNEKLEDRTANTKDIETVWKRINAS